MSVPLCVDCDGTLIRADLLHESALAAVKQSPLSLLALPAMLAGGKVGLKSFLASRVRLDLAAVPLRDEVVELIRKARAEGRRILLVTASHESLALELSRQHDLFDEVIATRDGGPNLSGEAKASELVRRFGKGGFDYAGDSWKDLPVWEQARRAIVVTGSSRLLAAVRTRLPGASVVEVEAPGAGTWIKAMRLHQWAKNALVLVPIFAAHSLGSQDMLFKACLAFLAFGLCASAVYVINDLLDLDSDRRHPRKRKRPFASGELSVPAGLSIALASFALSLSLTFLLGPAFQIVLALYFLLTLTYSVRLKQQVMVDVMMLAALYTMRIVAGSVATGIIPSFWLLAFSMFVFLSLALLKRYTELRQQEASGLLKAAGRGYLTSDLPVLLSLGTGAAMVAVMVFALFINAPATIEGYRQPIWLWLIPPLLLYWSSRIWLKAHRGQVHDDPLVFALKDWQSLAVLALAALIFSLAH